jgi:WhiB family transcriptional regulator, redox-sensing transcriptional regulator
MGWEHGGRRSPEGLRDQRFQWQQEAACRNVDTNVFFAQNRVAQNDEALFWCQRCPVRDECADYAWNNRIEYGIYGGVLESERAAGIRYMPQRAYGSPSKYDRTAEALRALELHRQGLRWRAITRETGVPARVLFKMIQQERIG